MKVRKFFTYVYKNLVQMKIIKKCKRSENIVITQGNIEELLIVFAIYATKNTKRDSSSIS